MFLSLEPNKHSVDKWVIMSILFLFDCFILQLVLLSYDAL